MFCVILLVVLICRLPSRLDIQKVILREDFKVNKLLFITLDCQLATTMPKCIKCNKGQTRLNEGDLCRICFISSGGKVTDDEVEAIDLSKSVAGMNAGELVKLIQNTVNPLVKPLSAQISNIETKINTALGKIEDLETSMAQNSTKIGKLEEETEENKATMNNTDAEVKTLKNVILEQQKYLEVIRRRELANVVTVTGIPKEAVKIGGTDCDTTEDKLKEILRFIGCGDCQYEIIPTNQVPDRNIFAKLKIRNQKNVEAILDNAKKLKDLKPIEIFINRDQPYHSRKENNRLRKKKFDLVQQHGKENIKIAKGKLLHNDIVVDQFDLSNQLF